MRNNGATPYQVYKAAVQEIPYLESFKVLMMIFDMSATQAREITLKTGIKRLSVGYI
jgi:hypothetical protein